MNTSTAASPVRCMQLYMKPLTFSTIILLALSACGQTPKSDKASIKANSVSKDTVTIYRNISLETCNCTFSTMKNNKPSSTMDSCYKAVLAKYNDSLKVLGFDPATQAGDLKLSNEVIGKLYLNCPDLSKLIQKEYENENAKKLLFKGTIASQRQLPSGEVEIILIESKTKKAQTFKSNSFLNDPSKTDKNTLSYELTVEYEIRNNPTTKKDEFYIKQNAAVIGTSVQKVDVSK
jgi:hypothetical protein